MFGKFPIMKAPAAGYIPHEFPNGFDDEFHETRWRVWAVIILLALLLHFFAFMAHVDWSKPALPPSVEIQQINPQKLAEIQKRWREQDKQLLLDKQKNAPKDAEAPKDARYMSDRNIHVDKEQRARQTAILPHAGAPATPQQQVQTKPEAQKAQRAQTQSRTLPKLGNLGVPFHLNETAKQQRDGQDKPREESQPNDPGGDQYVDDKKLPEGSENMLNAEESVYYSFYARLYEAIGPIWSARLQEIIPGTRVLPGEYTTAVDVVFDAEGNLIGVNLLQTSGVRDFDQAVNDAWKKVGRFPNPPSGLLKNGEVHTGWNFTVQVGGGGMGVQLMPPERTY